MVILLVGILQGKLVGMHSAICPCHCIILFEQQRVQSYCSRRHYSHKTSLGGASRVSVHWAVLSASPSKPRETASPETHLYTVVLFCICAQSNSYFSHMLRSWLANCVTLKKDSRSTSSKSTLYTNNKCCTHHIYY